MELEQLEIEHIDKDLFFLTKGGAVKLSVRIDMDTQHMIEEFHTDFPEDQQKEGAFPYFAFFSFSRKHINYIDPDRLDFEELGEEGVDWFPLSYFEHGQCSWFPAAGRAPIGVEFRWDGVRFAGIAVPAADAVNDHKRDKEALLTACTQACNTYTSWCNGDVYWYTLEYATDAGVYEDSCGGFIGSHFEENGMCEGIRSALAHWGIEALDEDETAKDKFYYLFYKERVAASE